MLKKYNKTFKSYNEMSNFKEPVVFLARRNRRVEFFEDATKGRFEFTHSDGEMGKIDLSPEYLNTFDYGKRTFKGYICHEDHPTPLPENPIVTAELFNIAEEKVLHDMKKWKKSEQEGIGLKWKQILIGIALVIAVPLGAKIIAGLFGVDLDINPFGGGGGNTQQVVSTASGNDLGATIIP